MNESPRPAISGGETVSAEVFRYSTLQVKCRTNVKVPGSFALQDVEECHKQGW